MELQIKRMLVFLKTWPLPVILLPLFFIVNIYIRFASLLDKNIILNCLLLILASLSSFYLLLYLIFKDKTKAGFLATFTAITFLYSGDIKNGLGQIPFANFISRNAFYCP